MVDYTPCSLLVVAAVMEEMILALTAPRTKGKWKGIHAPRVYYMLCSPIHYVGNHSVLRWPASPRWPDLMTVIESARRSDSLNGAGMTLKQLVNHYTQHELPRLAYSTQAAYVSYLNSSLMPVWGNHQLREVKAVAVESWLGTLPFKNGTKAKLRNILCSLFSHACRWEFTDRNPITHVRQATQRATQPVVLTNAEITALLSELREPARTAVFLALATGLRVSELLALQWQDIDFSNNTLTPTRGIV